jgi:hypothetical protein
MFDLNYIALSLGVNVESGGLSVKEEELKVGADNTVTTTETPVAFDGTMIGWYKKPTDTSKIMILCHYNILLIYLQSYYIAETICLLVLCLKPFL